MPRATKEQPAVKRTKAAAKPVAETKQPKRAVSKPVDIPKPKEVPNKSPISKTTKLTPKQKNEALKLKLQQLLEEL